MDEVRDVIIVGGGPAALTAAVYAARARLRTVVYEGPLEVAGGQLMTTTEVENFPGFPSGGVSGPELIERMRKQAVEYGADIRRALVESIDRAPNDDLFLVGTPSQVIKARAVILATGASAKYLGVRGEQEFKNKGVSACATCDGALPRFRNQPVVVVGGGDSAAEDALFLARFASRVHVVHRRDQLRASPIMAERLLAHERVQMHWNATVHEMVGTDADGLTGVVLLDTKSNETSVLPCRGVFVAIGHTPNSQLAMQMGIPVDDDGYICRVGRTSATTCDGFYVAGDVADPTYRQAVTAAGSGCQAAIEVTRWLDEHAL